MTLLQMELSQLEVEPLEILVDIPTPEPNSDLETLTHSKGEVDLIGVLTVKGTSPSNSCACACSGICDNPPPTGTCNENGQCACGNICDPP